ncbi:TetR/AcrR family transcriptional regulator [Hoyosella rhizosphaerae]|nr:TetR/AcrR family transcriptional regulator [Hoyosella rhizosphaerae]
MHEANRRLASGDVDNASSITAESPKAGSTKPTTRQRMIYSAIALMSERGSAGVTIDSILAHSGAPRGSVYYHFPGGRTQIISEALAAASDVITSRIRDASAQGIQQGLSAMREFWKNLIVGSDFEAGCPIVAVIAGGGEDGAHNADQVAKAFADVQEILVAALVDEGFPPHRVDPLARFIIAAYEGAIILCRAQRSLTPLDEVTAELALLISSQVD